MTCIYIYCKCAQFSLVVIGFIEDMSGENGQGVEAESGKGWKRRGSVQRKPLSYKLELPGVVSCASVESFNEHEMHLHLTQQLIEPGFHRCQLRQLPELQDRPI